MLNSKLTRTLLGVVMMSAPALAIIPPELEIRIGGAALIEPYHYAVHEGDLIALAVNGKAGESIWAFACPMNRDGEVDYSITLTLLLEKAQGGTIFGMFEIPKGLAGQSFSIEAFGLAPNGEVGKSTTLRVDVKGAPRLVQSTDPLGDAPVVQTTDPVAADPMLSKSDKAELGKPALMKQ